MRLSQALLPRGLKISFVGFIRLINRESITHWRGWSRDKFVEHLQLLYPQLSNAAEKSYLDMIKDIPFQYDLDNPVVELKFQSELSKTKDPPKINVLSALIRKDAADQMSTFHLYPHSEVIASSFTERFEDMLRWLYKTIKPTVIAANTGEHGAVKSSLNISVSCIRNYQTRLTNISVSCIRNYQTRLTRVTWR